VVAVPKPEKARERPGLLRMGFCKDGRA
jgi:hypothetical protein